MTLFKLRLCPPDGAPIILGNNSVIPEPPGIVKVGLSRLVDIGL